MNIVATAHLQGRLSLETLKKAFQQVYDIQPSLRVRVQSHGKDFFFMPDVSFADIPFVVIKRNGDNHWQQVVTEQLHRLFPIQDYLWRFVVLTDQSSHCHEIFLVCMHSVGDGVSLMHMFDQLFTLYASIEAGALPNVCSYQFLPPIEHLMCHQPTALEVDLGHEHIDEEHPTTWIFKNNADFNERRTKNIYREFDQAILSRLKKRCRTEGVTVNAALNAALVVAAQKYYKDTVNVRLSTPVNLRQKYCKQVIDNAYVGHYFTVATSVEPDVTEQIDFWQVARIYNKRLKKMIPMCASVPWNMSYEQAISFCDKLAKPRNHYAGGFSVSNVGQLDFASRYGSLEATGFHFCSNRSLGFVVMILNVLSFKGTMFMCFSYTQPLLNDEDAQFLVDAHITSLLENI